MLIIQLFFSMKRKNNEKNEEKLKQIKIEQDNTDEFDMFSDDIPQQISEKTSVKKEYFDNWDDSEGYLIFNPGDIFNKKYKSVAFLGKGVYSTVFQGLDLETNEEVAIKILRNNDIMKKSGQREVEYLRKLAESDTENKHFLSRMKSHFMHKGHLCIVFPQESMNLRQALVMFGKENGKPVGFNLKAVRIYAYQLLMGLKLLKKNQILHSDIKPDNILVNSKRNLIKLSDLGSVVEVSDVINTRIDELVSRYYRAPEIALGLEYDYQIDLWSVACTLYELATGKVLFESKNNNHMLFLHMQLKGPFPKKMLKKSLYKEKYFDQNDTFLYEEYDEATNKSYIKKVNVQKTRNLKDLLDEDNSNEELLNSFIDFLENCLILDPNRRYDVDKAIQHPFITGKPLKPSLEVSK